jgi:hypothetical protein
VIMELSRFRGRFGSITQRRAKRSECTRVAGAQRDGSRTTLVGPSDLFALNQALSPV